MKRKQQAGPESLVSDLRRLEEIVRQMEAEEIDLDQALTLFEEGVGLLRSARERLTQAEATVAKVLENADGTLRVVELDE
jgi:exodeoxyribonuclease VII small subunit